MTDNELLLAISKMLDIKLETKLEPIKQNIWDINLRLENKIEPQIQLLAENYILVAKRYEKATNELTELKEDDKLLKML